MQGMVYEKEEIKHFFREPTWNVKYLFKIDNKIYKGEKEKINVPILSGQPLIIYVNKIELNMTLNASDSLTL